MTHTCRFCQSTNLRLILDLGTAPPSNAFLTVDQLDDPETYYPLRLFFCEDCALVQLPEYKAATEIFKDDYPYFSSQSPSNVSHAKEYCDMVCERFGYGEGTKVLEIGSNDGYMLQWFKEKGCEVGGIDPAKGPAQRAWNIGIPTLEKFFNKAWAQSWGKQFDLICNINTLAHQPDISDFVEGMKIALAPKGVITCEFPHLMNLVDECQFDTVYQEHYCYFSFMTICHIFHKHGLDVFDADEMQEHGGSLRIYARHIIPGTIRPWVLIDSKVGRLYQRELDKGMASLNYYRGFQARADTIKNDLVLWLHQQKYQRENVVGYGAPAKANTLLNFCGIRADLIDFVVDRSPHKIGKFLPGSRIPVVSEDAIKELKPAYILILAWNLRDEIVNQLSYIREWNGKFIIAVPELEVL
jgi:SAM-dependent methyltransferase